MVPTEVVAEPLEEEEVPFQKINVRHPMRRFSVHSPFFPPGGGGEGYT